MMRKLILGAVAAAFLAGPALATTTPTPGRADPRVRTVVYDPAQVVRIVGVFRTATQILFADDEEIIHIALGDTTAWEVAAEGSILFLKPRERNGDTNLIVSTRHNGELRNYNFELSVRQGRISAHTPDTFFQVRFAYPGDERAKALVGEAARVQALVRQATDAALDAGVVTGPRNLRYTEQGSSALAPSEISDNGKFTVMRFPAGQEIPSIFTTNPDRTEALVSTDVRGEFVVLHTVQREFRLRRGNEVLCIYNEAPAQYGVDYGTKTVSPHVERTLRQGPQQ